MNQFQNNELKYSFEYLKPGDVVDIIAPASKAHPSLLNNIRALLAAWGLKCHIPNDIFGESLLYANSDENRFNQLKLALLNTHSKAVWCLLGGYGSTKLIPMLSQIQPPAQAKIFIGFSDITALHIFLQCKWGWPTIHGPSGYQAALKKVSMNSINLLKELLFHHLKLLVYNEIVPLNTLAQKNKVIEAPIVGGNLHMIQASLGTSWQINTDKKILFIEEINERGYRIDRVLSHLNQAGIIEKSRAILLGDFIDKGEPDGRFLVKETLQAFSSQCAVPVLQISNIGHGQTNNPILLGQTAKLIMGDIYHLEFVL